MMNIVLRRLFICLSLEQMKLSSKNLSEIVKPYQKYFHSGEVNFKVDSKDKIIKKLKISIKTEKNKNRWG